MLFPILPDPRYFNPVETSRGFPMAIDAPLYGPRKYSLFQSRTGSADYVPYALVGPGGRVTVDGRGRIVLAHRAVLPILSARRQIGGAFGGSGAQYKYNTQYGGVITSGFTFLSAGLVYMPTITITQTQSTGVIFKSVNLAPTYNSYVIIEDNATPGERRRTWTSSSTPQTFSSGGNYLMHVSGMRDLVKSIYDYAVSVPGTPSSRALVPPSAIPGAMDSSDERLFFPYAEEPPFYSVARDRYPSHTSDIIKTGAVYSHNVRGIGTMQQSKTDRSGIYAWTIDTDLSSEHDERAIFSHFGINGTPGSRYNYRFKGNITLSGANGEPLRAAAGKLMLRIYRVKESAHTAEYITDDPANTEAAAKWPPLELLHTLELVTIAAPVDSAEPVPYPVNAGLTFELEACRLYCFELYFDGVAPLELVDETIEPLEGTSAPAWCAITHSAVASLSYGASEDILDFFNP